jgi:hypothetical protein
MEEGRCAWPMLSRATVAGRSPQPRWGRSRARSTDDGRTQMRVACVAPRSGGRPLAWIAVAGLPSMDDESERRLMRIGRVFVDGGGGLLV